MEPLRSLHLEDQRPDAELVKAQLTIQDVLCVVQWGADRVSFLTVLEHGNIDLILRDFEMPGFDGLTALALAREKQPNLPFIFVSGAIGEERVIESLKQGVTDYVL
jgi:CheY-like chemotaxis protein